MAGKRRGDCVILSALCCPISALSGTRFPVPHRKSFGVPLSSAKEWCLSINRCFSLVEKVPEDCCAVEEKRIGSTCPSCLRSGRRVKPITVAVMAKNTRFYLHVENLSENEMFFCPTEDCDVVYYDTEHHLIFRKPDIRVRVWQKEKVRDDVPVCYCFHHTISSIRKEYSEKGKSDVAARISAEVRATNCRCEVANPQGSCCLGNVSMALKLVGSDMWQATCDSVTSLHG